MKPPFNIKIIKNDPERDALREEAGATVAFFFPEGRLIVNATTQEEEIRWATLAGQYGTPGLIAETLQASVDSAYRDGYNAGMTTILNAISRVFPGQEVEIGPKLKAALKAMSEEQGEEE